MKQAIERLSSRLATPVDGASIALFRICFGLLILADVIRYFKNGWISAYWIQPEFNFTYLGFDWVKPWPGDGMFIHFLVLGAAALAFTLGFRYRIAAVVMFLAFLYQFLLERAVYLNHFYAATLFAFILIFIPANSTWSLDVVAGRTGDKTGVPNWSLWLLRFQVAVIYVFGGIAKINGDWLRGEPIARWARERTDAPFVAFMVEHGWEVPFFAWGGMLFDLLIVPALLFRITRIPAVIALLMFHILNSGMFDIGIFPWMMLAATTIFFAPDWPRRVRVLLYDYKYIPADRSQQGSFVASRRLLWFLGAYAVVQLIVPLRHYLYPGDVAWTEEGHEFSWRMMLRSKSGALLYRVVTDSGARTIDPAEHLEPWQARKLAVQPDLILQYAHILADTERRANSGTVQVRAVSLVSLNDRPQRLMIDSTVDLAAQPRNMWPASYIVRAP